MPKITAHGHRPECLGTLQALNTVRSHVATRSYQALPSSGSTALDATVRTLNLGLIKLKIHPSPAEIALREQVRKLEEKATPYASKYGFSWVDLNCLVQVTPGKSPELGSEPVVCRHLATKFAAHAGKKRELMLSFSTKDGITEKFDGKLDDIHAAFEKIVEKTPPGCKHLVNSEQLGAYLKAMARQLQAPGCGKGPSQANCLLMTADHVMALQVQRKSKNGVGYFSAKLYDPNETSNYRRVVKVNPEDFGNLKLKDMMIRPELIDHYAHGESECLSMVAMSLDHRLQPLLDTGVATATAANMHVALQCGLHAEVQSMLKTALGGTLAPDEAIKLLRANLCTDGVTFPAFFRAFHHGHVDSVKVFSRAVLKSTLSPEVKVDLLAAKRSDGLPGLYMALQKGHTAAIQVFVQEVLDSRLSQDTKVDLLGAWSGDDLPGLFVALHLGHRNAVKAFAHEVLESKLTEQAKVNLLAAKRGDGKTRLFIARQEGQYDAAQAFAEEVLASDLSPRAKRRLLSCVS